MKIKVNQAQLSAAKLMLQNVKNAVPKIQTRAINKTLTGTQTQAKREVAKHYNLSQKRIGQNMSIKKASFAEPSAFLRSTGRPIGLASFTGTRQTAKGVSVKVLKEKKRTVIKHAFIRVIRGGKNVFWREREWDPNRPFRKGFPYGRLPRKYRLPITRRTGPRVEDELSKDRTLKFIQKYAGDRMLVVTEQEINFELSKL